MNLRSLLRPSTINCIVTSCPSRTKKNEAENILKTKTRKKAFSKNEAENVLTIKPLTKNHRNSNKSDKLTDRQKSPLEHVRGGMFAP